MIPNVLAQRYASAEMRALFDPVNRIRIERELWLAVLQTQAELGMPLDDGVVDDYRAVIDKVDLASIEARERVTRHDVKARLEEFNALAGHEDVHRAMTSRDLTENVEQVLVARALCLVDERTVALLARLAERARELVDMVIVGRTHNVAAQPTTVGKRLAQVGEELLAAHAQIRSLRERAALRGIKGPVGSQQDQIDLLGSATAAARLDAAVARHLGFDRTLDAVGQVYPRSLDYAVVAGLLQLASGPANLALTVRLMAGNDLATEGFRPGQVGSSAMPHKMNTRSCERINGLHSILKGHLTMAADLTGNQWSEGDVSCSVVRRVVIPDAFFALDGLMETTFAVVADFGVYPGVIAAELDRYGPFLATTGLLLHAVRAGMGREEAHEVIKEHAVAAALRLRDGTGDGSELVRRLADDPRFPGTDEALAPVVAEVGSAVGAVSDQVESFARRVDDLVAGSPDSDYRGADII
ncbi:MAG: adenylosuccinate lyase [Acidimicrobiales bacterium]